MSGFICPVCGSELETTEKTLTCPNNHNFDKAKSGYVNLLLSQQAKTKRHGDDKLMARARQDFLNKGYYNTLLDTVCTVVKNYAQNGSRILDAGCGECWYTAHIYDFLTGNKIATQMLAVDISKDALSLGAKRGGNIELAVASIFRLPVKECSVDILLNFFAPYCQEEFSRVLKKGGILIRVVPLEKHLMSLKTAIYDKPYENESESFDLEGFQLLEKHEIKNRLHISTHEDIQNVFSMTPYYYKTSTEDQNKLGSLNELDTEIEFGVPVYRKR